MKKNVSRWILVISFCSGLFFACKEDDPGVNYKIPEKPLLDTSYISSAVSADSRNVLIMDITGVRCINCPTAAKIAKDIQNANPAGRVNIVALYPWYQLSNTAPWDGYDTLNSDYSEYLASQFGQPVGMPSGHINQILYNNNRFVPYNQWAGVVATELAEPSEFNIQLKSSWDNSNNRARVEIKNIYTGNATSKNYLMYLAVLENEIVGKQKGPDSIFYYYKFEHVLRKLITANTGDSLKKLDNQYKTFEKHYYIMPEKNWKADHLNALVWIVDADTRNIIQSKEIKLK